MEALRGEFQLPAFQLPVPAWLSERASRTLRGISWFEVLQTRGQVESGKLQYQVVLKVGFTLEEPS